MLCGWNLLPHSLLVPEEICWTQTRSHGVWMSTFVCCDEPHLLQVGTSLAGMTAAKQQADTTVLCSGADRRT